MACNNCNNTVNSQKLLPCFHSICLLCLDEREDNWSEGKKKTCPTCDEEFRIPSQSLEDNLFAERFCRLGRGLCDVCSDDQSSIDSEVPTAAAAMYCPLCCQGLCERCAVEHRRQKPSKSHHLMEFSSPEVLMKASKTDALAYCVEHSAVSQRILCSTCRRLVCVLCFLEDHADKSHRWSKPDEEIAELRKNLQQSVEQMSSLLGDIGDSKELVLGNESRRLRREELQIQEEIGRQYESLKEMIDEHRNKLLLELDARKSRTLEQIERGIDAKTRNLSNRLTGCIDYFQQLTTCGSYDELHSALVKLKQTPGLQNNLKERYLKEIEDYRLTESLTLTFQPLQLPTDNFIGSITCRSTSRRARIQLDDAGKMDAWGVAWLDNCIYILTSNSILKFSDQSPFDRLEAIVIFDAEAERYLSDIAACPTNERLYIIDQVDFKSNEPVLRGRKCESCIWKVEINSDPRNKVSKWVTKWTYSSPFTLSVSPSGQVIVADPSYESNIEIYDKDGELVESINLHARHANHAIATNDHGFLVAYGKYQEKHGLRLVGPRDQRDITDLDLNNPWYLAVYENDDILLADMKSDRVLLLNPTLEMKRELLTKEHDEVIEPRRLCYVKERRMLIVIHGEKGKTRVVDLFYDNYWGLIGP